MQPQKAVFWRRGLGMLTRNSIFAKITILLTPLTPHILVYELLVLDLDGTLTNSKKEITPHTLEVLLEAQRQGLRIVLASGRPVFGIAPLADQLHLAENDGYVLAYNGGQIVRWSDHQVIDQQMLDPEVLPYVYECSKRQFTDKEGKLTQFQILSYRGDVVFTENPGDQYVNYECWLNRIPCEKVDNFLEAVDCLLPKCLIVGDPEPLHELELEMAEYLKGKNGVYRSEAFFLEIVPLGIDKAQRLSVLLEHLGMTREEMICVGDGYNDQSMIEYAGLGVAMQNAKPEVRAVADYITLSNEEDGVAAVVEKFCLAQ